MNCESCGSDPCLCQMPIKPAGPVFRSTEHPLPPNVITKEQFGLNLFNAIFTIGQILGEQNKVRLAKNPYLKRAAQQTAQALRLTLSEQMDALSDADAAEIVRRYPWVMQ